MNIEEISNKSEQQKKTFARLLTYYMNIKGVNQTELSDKINISLSTVNSWCTGNKMPRMDKIQLLADFFGINKSDLLEEKSNSEDYYLNDDARDMANFLFENPDYKVLFDASRKVRKEDIKFVKEMIDRMSGRDKNDDFGC